jgi:copper chaperone CopZ
MNDKELIEYCFIPITNALESLKGFGRLNKSRMSYEDIITTLEGNINSTVASVLSISVSVRTAISTQQKMIDALQADVDAVKELLKV